MDDRQWTLVFNPVLPLGLTLGLATAKLFLGATLSWWIVCCPVIGAAVVLVGGVIVMVVHTLWVRRQ